MKHEVIFDKTGVHVSKQMENYQWIKDFCDTDTDEILTVFRVFDVHRKDISISENDWPSSSANVTIKIGSFSNGIYTIPGEVLNSNFSLYVRPGNELDKMDYFTNQYHVKIMKWILETVHDNITIGNEEGDLRLETLDSMIKRFPTRTDVQYYIKERICNIVSEDLGIDKDYESAHQRYIDSKRNQPVKSFVDINEYDLKRLRFVRRHMEEMLKAPDAYGETDWQEAIKTVAIILFPQYIHASREKCLTEVFGHQRRVDFLLIDSTGYVDIMEIKKPCVPILKPKPDKHNNIVPAPAFTSCVMQVETYIYSLLKSTDGKLVKIAQKILNDEGINLKLNVLNPRGLIVMGYFDDITTEEEHALEIIRRQFSHIVDIITYNDLIQRIDNMIAFLIAERKRSN